MPGMFRAQLPIDRDEHDRLVVVFAWPRRRPNAKPPDQSSFNAALTSAQAANLKFWALGGL